MEELMDHLSFWVSLWHPVTLWILPSLLFMVLFSTFITLALLFLRLLVNSVFFFFPIVR